MNKWNKNRKEYGRKRWSRNSDVEEKIFSVTDKDTNVTSLLRVKFHKRTKLIIKTYKYENIYPVSCSSSLDVNREINFDFTCNQLPTIDEFDKKISPMMEYYNKWKEGLV